MSFDRYLESMNIDASINTLWKVTDNEVAHYDYIFHQPILQNQDMSTMQQSEESIPSSATPSPGDIVGVKLWRSRE